MKRMLLFLAMLLTALPIYAQYELGTSSWIKSAAKAADFISMIKSGITYLEVDMDDFYYGVPENELYSRAYAYKAEIDRAGMKVWSCHLPFSEKLDISVADPELREQNLELLERMIRLCSIFQPKRLVLHASSEPIADSLRPERLQCSRNSIGRLALAAKEIGAVLCVENLPRTCLGRDSKELLWLIEPYPDVMVCFDSNHLLTESHADFFRDCSGRIGTVHVSDYDGIDERHWIPGHKGGVINWKEFLRMLRKSGYEGVFMFEVAPGVTYDELRSAYDGIR
jgi:sugar phosphate isomerase/epimerase